MHSPTMAVFLHLQSTVEIRSCSVREGRNPRTRMSKDVAPIWGLSLESQPLMWVCVQRLKKLESQEVGVGTSGLMAAAAVVKITPTWKESGVPMWACSLDCQVWVSAFFQHRLLFPVPIGPDTQDRPSALSLLTHMSIIFRNALADIAKSEL